MNFFVSWIIVAHAILSYFVRSAPKRFNLNALDQEWTKGDDKIELQDEHEHLMEIEARKRQEISFSNIKDGEVVPPELLMKYQMASGMKAGMIFVELKSKDLKGQDWTVDSVGRLASRWHTLLRTGGLTASVYDIGDLRSSEASSPRLLVNIEKGWMTSDVIKFLFQQKETQKVTKDNENLNPALYQLQSTEDAEDDDGL